MSRSNNAAKTDVWRCDEDQELHQASLAARDYAELRCSRQPSGIRSPIRHPWIDLRCSLAEADANQQDHGVKPTAHTPHAGAACANWEEFERELGDKCVQAGFHEQKLGLGTPPEQGYSPGP